MASSQAGIKQYTDDHESEPLSEHDLEELYSWVDKIPLSRPKRNINRDFADGVMAAEVVKYFLPKLVDVHNYTAASATAPKMQNWYQLNRKVFKKLNFVLTEDLIRDICIGKANVVERFLMHLRAKIERAVWDLNKEVHVRAEMSHQQQKSNARLTKGPRGMINDKPEADQNIDTANFPTYYAEKVPSKPQHKTATISPGRKPQPQAGPYKGNQRIKIMDETVPRAVYEEKEQECLAKEETIQILQAKVHRLAHLLHLKDIRIEDLQNRLETTRPTGLAKR